MKTQSYEEAKAILSEFSKEILIEYMLDNGHIYFRPIKRSTLLTMLWRKEEDKFLKENAALSEELEAIDLKTRDELARKCNAEADIKKKLEIMEQIEPYEKKLLEWFNKHRKLDEKQKQVDALYASIDKARKEEDNKI